MKKLLFSVFFGILICSAAKAADITLYYSPYCPHCHHARDFFVNNLVYEYPNLKVVQVNVMEESNLPQFQEVLKKCEYESGGVPVIVVGNKCFQGYADFMNQELRDAVEVDLSEADKRTAAENKKSLEENPDVFRSNHADRQKAISEYNAAADAAAKKIAAEKKNKTGGQVYFYILLIILVAVLGFVLIRKENNKK